MYIFILLKVFALVSDHVDFITVLFLKELSDMISFFWIDEVMWKRFSYVCFRNHDTWGDMFVFCDISVCIFGSGNKFSCNCSRSGSVILLKRSLSGTIAIFIWTIAIFIWTIAIFVWTIAIFLWTIAIFVWTIAEL